MFTIVHYVHYSSLFRTITLFDAFKQCTLTIAFKMVFWHHFYFWDGDYSPLSIKWFFSTTCHFWEWWLFTIVCQMVSQHHPWFCENVKWFLSTILGFVRMVTIHYYVKWFLSTILGFVRMVTTHHWISNGFSVPLVIFENGDYSPLYVKWLLNTILVSWEWWLPTGTIVYQMVL